MNLDEIKKAATCRVDEEEQVFIVESSLLEICIGADETEARAWEIFDDILEAMHEAYLEGTQVGPYKLDS